MEDKKNAVIVVDFGQNTFGGYFIKYSDGSIRSLCKEQLIEILNNKREAIHTARGRQKSYWLKLK